MVGLDPEKYMDRYTVELSGGSNKELELQELSQQMLK